MANLWASPGSQPSTLGGQVVTVNPVTGAVFSNPGETREATLGRDYASYDKMTGAGGSPLYGTQGYVSYAAPATKQGEIGRAARVEEADRIAKYQQLQAQHPGYVQVGSTPLGARAGGDEPVTYVADPSSVINTPEWGAIAPASTFGQAGPKGTTWWKDGGWGVLAPLALAGLEFATTGGLGGSGGTVAGSGGSTTLAGGAGGDALTGATGGVGFKVPETLAETVLPSMGADAAIPAAGVVPSTVGLGSPTLGGLGAGVGLQIPVEGGVLTAGGFIPTGGIAPVTPFSGGNSWLDTIRNAMPKNPSSAVQNLVKGLMGGNQQGGQQGSGYGGGGSDSLLLAALLGSRLGQQNQAPQEESRAPGVDYGAKIQQIADWSRTGRGQYPTQ